MCLHRKYDLYVCVCVVEERWRKWKGLNEKVDNEIKVQYVSNAWPKDWWLAESSEMK